MITAYLTGAVVMAWHLWTRRARHVHRGNWKSWAALPKRIDDIFTVAFWPLHIITTLLDI